MEIGEICIYRNHEYAPSERVQIVDIQRGKQSYRADIEFLDGDKVGVLKNVLGNRLRGHWSDVDEYDLTMANWESLEDFKVTDVEESAIETVFELLVPESVATWEWKPIHFVTIVHAAEALMKVTGVPTPKLIADIAWFEQDGETMLSPEGTLLIAELACRRNPMPILEWVIEEEKVKREQCKRGGKSRLVRGSQDITTSPEWEYELYLKYSRPLHELLRQWCGHRAVSFQEHLDAAEAESRRLDVIVTRLIDALKSKGDQIFANAMEQEREEERITPEKLRPIVDRPLHPSEIPVRVERVWRRWS